MRLLKALALAAALGAAVLLSGDQASAYQQDVRLTVYLPTGNVMYSGHYPYWGAAACSWNFPLYTVLELPDGHQVTCLDRGLLGSSGWVDLYAPDWATGAWLQRYYGEWTSVRVVRWGRS